MKSAEAFCGAYMFVSDHLEETEDSWMLRTYN